MVYIDRFRHPDIEKTYCECVNCGRDIYYGEDYYEVNLGNAIESVHKDCFEELAKDALQVIERIAGDEY